MSITIKYFASLAEELGRREDQVDAAAAATVGEAWVLVNARRPLPDNVLCAVNHEYVERSHQISDGDEVAFFPPVTGG